MLAYNMDDKMKVKKRKIFINNLILIASIGVYEKEKKNKQKIIVNFVDLTRTSDKNMKCFNIY
jgi:dihydroneopterin aldolase